MIARIAAFALCVAVAPTALGQLELAPLTSFGGDGWLAPGESDFNDQTNATVRGIAYNPMTNNVYVVDRDGGLNIEVRNGDTGALVDTLDTTGITGGTFTGNMIGVGGDGAIYMGNLVVGDGFKVYRWADESSAPTVAFDDLTGRDRTGDSFAVLGSGADTQIVSSGGSGDNGFFHLTTADGTSFTGSNVTPTSGPANGAFRLGIDFANEDNVIGTQAGAVLSLAPTAGGDGQTFALNAASETIIGHYIPGNVLVTVDFNSNDVRLYDSSDLSALTSTGFLDLENLTDAVVSNGNGVGEVALGEGPDGVLRVYALNANNGIQAFQVIPEPASLALLGLGAVAGLRRRR